MPLIQGEYPLLFTHFKQYLNDWLNETIEIQEGDSQTLTFTNVEEISRKVKDYIMSLVPVCLEMVGSDQSDLLRKNRLHQNQFMLGKSQALDIYSPMNASNEMLKAVKSTPFFMNANSYSGIIQTNGSPFKIE